jgi:23S rRNA G2445 N2-methylase RlmL
MRFFATCSRGTEGALRAELAALKLPAVRGGRGGVHFEGRLEHGAKACLHSRTAMRILLELATFPVDGADSLYEGARAVDWTEWLTERTTLAVECSGSAPGLTHTGFAALKVKDAVVDVLRDKLGARPDVDTKDPDVRIVLHLDGASASLSLDLAGDPLHKRGWRTTTTVAPLKETLAASVLLLGRVALDLPFIDPLCGSGTLAIEHALRARRIAPGLDRAFGFQRWPPYRGELQSRWDKLKAQATAEILPAAPAPIVARDLHPKAIDACRRNAHLAGVTADVVIEQGDARDLEPRFERGTLCMNPPYGERLMGGAGVGEDGEPLDRAALRTQERKLTGFYRGLAEMLLRHRGWAAVVLAGGPELPKAIDRKAEIDHRLFNGPLEVHLLRYRL